MTRRLALSACGRCGAGRLTGFLQPFYISLTIARARAAILAGMKSRGYHARYSPRRAYMGRGVSMKLSTFVLWSGRYCSTAGCTRRRPGARIGRRRNMRLTLC